MVSPSDKIRNHEEALDVELWLGTLHESFCLSVRIHVSRNVHTEPCAGLSGAVNVLLVLQSAL